MKDFYKNLDEQEISIYLSANTIICKKCKTYMTSERKQNGITWRCPSCDHSFFEKTEKD